MRYIKSALIAIAGALGACREISVIERSESAGFNGGFEIERAGLPVNWYLYHESIRSGDTEVA